MNKFWIIFVCALFAACSTPKANIPQASSVSEADSTGINFVDLHFTELQVHPVNGAKQPATPEAPIKSKPQPTETFILLPDAEGKQSGIVIKTSDQEVAVTEPLHAVELTGGKVVNKTLTAEEIRQQFPDVMQVLPERQRSFILRFESKATKLTPESLATIRDIQKVIANRAAPEIIVIGHTDRQGSAEDNLRLSLSRAGEVRDILVAGGVSAQIIQVVGRGELEPVVATEDGVAEPLNRRVEITVR